MVSACCCVLVVVSAWVMVLRLQYEMWWCYKNVFVKPWSELGKDMASGKFARETKTEDVNCCTKIAAFGVVGGIMQYMAGFAYFGLCVVGTKRAGAAVANTAQ